MTEQKLRAQTAKFPCLRLSDNCCYPEGSYYHSSCSECGEAFVGPKLVRVCFACSERPEFKDRVRAMAEARLRESISYHLKELRALRKKLKALTSS